MERSIIIIGGGLAGLSAGCYARMNGYKTTIFEMHSIPGGVCTAWKRKGYTIDGAVNWVIGTQPGGMFSRFWAELGVSQQWSIFNHERSRVIETRDGRAFTFFCDADRLERLMLEVAPEDAVPIHEMTAAIRHASRFTMPEDKPEELYGPLDMVKMVRMLPMMRFLRRWTKVPIGDFAARFKSPFLREVFALAFEPHWPMFVLLMTSAWQHSRCAGYIIGGALPLVRAIERRYAELGGTLSCNARVEKILVENDTAVGVRLSDGSEHRADWVVSAADGRTTIFDMLEGRYVDEALRRRYAHPLLFEPLVYVALGVAADVPEIPASIGGLTFPLLNPILVGTKREETLTVRSYCFDPTLAPPGKSVLVVQFESDYDFWRALREDMPRYKAEKERIAAAVIEALEQRIPGIGTRIEMTDVATPITWERYTGNWRGSYEGWMFDSKTFTKSMKKTLPGLHNFLMAGQWVNPGGGIPTAIMSGNHTVQLICRKDRRRFRSS